MLFCVVDILQLERCLRLLLAAVTYTTVQGLSLLQALAEIRRLLFNRVLRYSALVLAVAFTGSDGAAGGAQGSRIWVSVNTAQLALPPDLEARTAQFNFTLTLEGDRLHAGGLLLHFGLADVTAQLVVWPDRVKAVRICRCGSGNRKADDGDRRTRPCGAACCCRRGCRTGGAGGPQC